MEISSPGTSIGIAARLAQPPPGFDVMTETEEPTIPGFGIVSEEDTEYYNFEAPTEAMRISQYVNPQTVDGMESITNGYLADFWKTNHKIHKRHIGFGEDGLPRVFEQVEYEIDGERMISLYHPNFVSKNIIPFISTESWSKIIEIALNTVIGFGTYKKHTFDAIIRPDSVLYWKYLYNSHYRMPVIDLLTNIYFPHIAKKWAIKSFFDLQFEIAEKIVHDLELTPISTDDHVHLL